MRMRRSARLFISGCYAVPSTMRRSARFLLLAAYSERAAGGLITGCYCRSLCNTSLGALDRWMPLRTCAWRAFYSCLLSLWLPQRAARRALYNWLPVTAARRALHNWLLLLLWAPQRATRRAVPLWLPLRTHRLAPFLDLAASIVAARKNVPLGAHHAACDLATRCLALCRLLLYFCVHNARHSARFLYNWPSVRTRRPARFLYWLLL